MNAAETHETVHRESGMRYQLQYPNILGYSAARTTTCCGLGRERVSGSDNGTLSGPLSAAEAQVRDDSVPGRSARIDLDGLSYTPRASPAQSEHAVPIATWYEFGKPTCRSGGSGSLLTGE